MQIELDENDDLLPHYDFDYSKSRPNRFAEAYKKGVTIRIINECEDSDDDGDQSDGSEIETKGPSSPPLTYYLDVE